MKSLSSKSIRDLGSEKSRKNSAFSIPNPAKGARRHTLPAAGIPSARIGEGGDPFSYPSPVGRSIVFIDANIADLSHLRGAFGEAVEIVLLDATQNGIAQITQILARRKGLEGIFILSRGDEGSVSLGSGVIDEGNVADHAEEIASWGDALAPDANILIYGCESFLSTPNSPGALM